MAPAVPFERPAPAAAARVIAVARVQRTLCRTRTTRGGHATQAALQSDVHHRYRVGLRASCSSASAAASCRHGRNQRIERCDWWRHEQRFKIAFAAEGDGKPCEALERNLAAGFKAAKRSKAYPARAARPAWVKSAASRVSRTRVATARINSEGVASMYAHYNA